MNRHTDPLVRAYRLALVALPPAFRRQFGDELTQLVADRLDERRGHLRSLARAGYAMHEALDVLRVGLRLRLTSGRSDARHVPSARPASTGTADTGGAPAGLPMRAAARALVRRPGFALLSTVTLAIGVGTATAIFAVTDAVLIRPLPYADSNRLAMFWRVQPRAGLERAPASYPDYVDFRRDVRAFNSLAAYRGLSATLLRADDPTHASGVRVTGARVSDNLFATLGAIPAIGRVIRDDDASPQAEPVVVLGEPIWHERFGGDSTVIGTMITLDETRHRVIGVMPRSFVFPGPTTQLWTALRVDPARAERDQNFLTLIGRLAHGVTAAQAMAQAKGVAERLATAYPDANPGASVLVEMRRDFVVRPVRGVLLLLGAGGALLLLLAVANVANLHLMRALARAPERAVRRALGASGGRLIGEQLAETVWIGVAAALSGAGIAFVLTWAALRHGPTLPRAWEIGVDARAIAFTIAAAFGCAIVASLLPSMGAIRGAARDLIGGIRAQGRPRARRGQQVLVAAQLALALTLLVGATLLTRSFVRLSSVPRGFDGAGVLTVQLDVPQRRYGSFDGVLAFYDRLLAQLDSIPGVTSTSGTWALPFSDAYASSRIVPADRPDYQLPAPIAMLSVRPAFFRTIGTRMIAGRDFGRTDVADAPAVAIVNETLARTFWPGGNAIGQRIRSADPSDADPPLTVVGVVADLKRRSLAEPPAPEVYLPHAQSAWTGGGLYLTLRVAGDPSAVAPAVRRTIASFDTKLPVIEMKTLDEMVGTTMVAPRFRSALAATLAGVALLLGLLGIYGTMGFAVAERMREMAIRSSLGASPRGVLTHVLGRGIRIVAAGIGVGLVAAAAGAPLLRAFLFEIAPTEWTVYAAGAVVLGGFAMVVCLIPARRAARVDPVRVLNQE